MSTPHGNGTHPWVQPILVAKTGTHLETLVAAAVASLAVWSADHTEAAYPRDNFEHWLAGPFTKSVRRASAAQVETTRAWAVENRVAHHLIHVTSPFTGTVSTALAFTPMRYADMAKPISKHQVHGTDFARTAQTVHDDGNTPVTLAVNADLTTGKAAAAAAHALWAWALPRARSADPVIAEAYDAWEAAAYSVRVTLLDSRDLAGAAEVPGAHPIIDAGLTEVDPHTLTAVALPKPMLRSPLTS